MEQFAPDESSNNARRDSNVTVESRYSSVPLPSPISAAMRSPIDLTELSIGPWASQGAESERVRPLMYVFGQQHQEADVPFTPASRLLFRRENKSNMSTFTALSPTTNGRFRKRQADPQDKLSMVSALRLPSDSLFMTRENGKRLKVTAPITILEGAQSERLNAVISVPRHKVWELIHQFENHEESEDEL